MKKACFSSGMILLVLAGMPAAWGAPATPVATKPVPARSEFVQPTSFQEGRDPFFPESSRAFATAMAAARPAENVALKAPGFSEVRGMRMAIINNHTFSVGDEGDVLVPGGRVHIRCLEIRIDMVIVEANGQRREIVFGAK